MWPFHKDWKNQLFIVKPETVIRWHRQGFRYYWRWKSRSKRGRPPIPMKLIWLIKRLSRENPLWGAPRIEKGLTLLGHQIAETSVSKYMIRFRKDPSPSWRAFLSNHMMVAAACDFFVVPTLTLKMLYCFVVLSHDRRRILHINVTTNSTARWTAHQIQQAFPGTAIPTYLHRDGDGIYGEVFREAVTAMGIDHVVSARRSPWQNPFVERLIGTIRRECTNHIIALGEAHLLQVLREYAEYYNNHRPHQSLAGNSPIPRCIECGDGDILSTPVLGGLHHTYRRSA